MVAALLRCLSINAMATDEYCAATWTQRIIGMAASFAIPIRSIINNNNEL